MKYAERRKQQFRQSIYRISLISFIVVVIWIGFEIYWAYKKQKDVNVDRQLLEPIDSELYLELAQKLDRREKIDQADLDAYLNSLPLEFTIELQPETTPTPVPAIVPEASDASNLSGGV